MEKKPEFRFIPLDYSSVAGRILAGTVIKYGEISTGAPRPERFISGAFGELRGADIIFNVHHDRGRPLCRTGEGGGLHLTDSELSLEMRAELPETKEAADALELVKRKVLRGLSVEFLATRETEEAGIRVIQAAQLRGIALVDTPAYTGSDVEARRRIGGVRLGFTIPKGRRLQCECAKGKVGKDAGAVEFAEGAFDDALAGDRDIIAVASNYKSPLGSKNRGSLKLTDSKDGLRGSLELPDTQDARDILAAAGQVNFYARPILDFEKSALTVSGDVAKIQRAHVRGILIQTTDANAGWDPLRVIRKNDNRRWLLYV